MESNRLVGFVNKFGEDRLNGPDTLPIRQELLVGFGTNGIGLVSANCLL